MIWVLTVFQRALFNKVACCSEQLVLYKYSTILYVMMIILSILEKSHIDQLFVYVLGPIIYSSKNKQNFYRGIGNTKPCLESWPRSVFKNAVNTWGTSLILCRVSHHKLMPQWILTQLSPNKMEESESPTIRPKSKQSSQVRLSRLHNNSWQDLFWRCISLTRVDIWLQRKLKADGSRHTIICASAMSKKISDQISKFNHYYYYYHYWILIFLSIEYEFFRNLRGLCFVKLSREMLVFL